jgi:hypothetical protein
MVNLIDLTATIDLEGEFTDEKIIQSNHTTRYPLFVWVDIISEKEKNSM